MDNIIYSEKFLGEKLKKISENDSIKFSVFVREQEFKNCKISFAYITDGKVFYKIKSHFGAVNDNFRYDSPRAAQFVHAYLTGKKTSLIDVWDEAKKYHENYLVECQNFNEKLNKLLEI